MNISQEDMQVLTAAQQGELAAVLMYNALAKVAKDPADAAVFRQLAAEEGRHAAVFRNYTGQVVKAKKTKAIMLPIMYRVLGRKKLYPIIAKGEYDAEQKYESVAARFPEVASVKADERRHGDMVLAMLER